MVVAAAAAAARWRPCVTLPEDEPEPNAEPATESEPEGETDPDPGRNGDSNKHYAIVIKRLCFVL